MVEVSLTVGKLDASLALLLTKDHHLIEFPTILLPNGVKAGSIVKIKCERDLETEAEERRKFQEIQDEILTTFGKNLPKPPVLKVKNVTQTSCVLEWDPLDLGTATLKNLVLFKDDKKLGSIHQPLSNRTTKLSGLPIDKTFKFQLRLDTTAGVYSSKLVEVKTHKMTDLSGITVCLGDITANDQFTVDDIQQTLKNMGAHYPAQEKLLVDTTHFITTRENKLNPEYMKANEMNIPIIRPEWLKACERERRIVGVRDFYVKDCVLPDILAKDYWKKNNSSQPPPPPPVPEKDASNSDASVTALVTGDNEMHEDSSTNVNEKSETISQIPEETKMSDSGLENPKEEAEKNSESAGQPLEEPIEAPAETFEQIPLDEDRVSEAPEKEELPDATLEEEEPKESSEKVLEGGQNVNEGKELMDLSQIQEKVEAKDEVSQKAKASNNDDYSEVLLSETAEQNVDADTTEAVDLTEPEHATDPTDVTEQAEIQALDEHAEEKAVEDSQTEADVVHVTEDKPDEADVEKQGCQGTTRGGACGFG